MLRAILAAAAIAATGPARAETIDAFSLAQQAIALRATGLTATYRNKTLTVTGEFDRLIDVGHGRYVHVAFQHPDNSGWKVTCAIDREDTATYDRYALMQPGTPISATGRFKAARDVFFVFELEPCQMH